MAMRIQEVHPSIVHLPIALLPVSLGLDFLGRVTRKKDLCEAGRWGIGLTAGTGLVAGLAGFVAQEAANVEGRAHSMLVTHRNLNLGMVGLTTAMAVHRAGKSRPGFGYLTLGLAGIGVVLYSAYLGGRMVYEYGVGVRAAGGTLEGQVPEIRPGEFGEAARIAGGHLQHGVQHTVEDFARGEILPELSHHEDEVTDHGPH